MVRERERVRKEKSSFHGFPLADLSKKQATSSINAETFTKTANLLHEKQIRFFIALEIDPFPSELLA